jgi:hypothetical protein
LLGENELVVLAKRDMLNARLEIVDVSVEELVVVPDSERHEILAALSWV